MEARSKMNGAHAIEATGVASAGTTMARSEAFVLARRGPVLLLGAAIAALAVTAAAAFIAPALAQAGTAAYIVSGVVMMAVDVATAMALIGLATSHALDAGRVKQTALALVAIGSLGM